MSGGLDLSLDPDVAATDRRRGHRFAPPKRVLAKIPALYATDGIGSGEKVVHVHYFVGGWDWYVVELDPETWEAYALVTSPAVGPRGEWGYVDLADLALVRSGATLNGVPFRQPIERDCFWTVGPLGVVVPSAVTS